MLAYFYAQSKFATSVPGRIRDWKFNTAVLPFIAAPFADPAGRLDFMSGNSLTRVGKPSPFS